MSIKDSLQVSDVIVMHFSQHAIFAHILSSLKRNLGVHTYVYVARMM